MKLFIDIDTKSIDPEIRSNPNPEIEWTIYDLLGRIVNGSKATLRQFPYQVRVVVEIFSFLECSTSSIRYCWFYIYI